MRRALLLSALLVVAPAAAASGQSTHAERDAELLRARAGTASAWTDMTTGERRRAMRQERAGRERRFARARAAAPGPRRLVGRWGHPFNISWNYRGYAIHAALLHTGKVLFWGYPFHEDSPRFRGNESYAWLWDPAEGLRRRAFEDVTIRDRDGSSVSIYCSGMSFLPDGRLLIVGGNKIWPGEDPDDAYTDYAGLDRAFLFDPLTESWTEVPRPDGSEGRWYPSQVLLPDGRTLVISGLTGEPPGGVLSETLEIYRRPSAKHPAGSFRLLTGAEQTRTTDLYPHLFVLPNGKVALAGPAIGDNALLDPSSLRAPWTDIGRQSATRLGGNAVLMPRGTAGSYDVLQVAGGADFGRPLDGRPLKTTEQIDLGAQTPVWRPGPPLHVARAYPNTVLLPDRSLVVVGGTDENSEDPLPPRQVELLGRGADRFRLGPAQTEYRGYHSTALLLPSGHVLSAGDDMNPTTDGTYAGASPFDTAEIYSPPYLFRGVRPKIHAAPRTVRYSRRFRVLTPSRVRSGLLAAPSAVTHGTDTTQRLVPLRVKARRRGRYVTLRAPANANLAPPGWYMLFLVDAKGRPSRAKFLRLR